MSGVGFQVLSAGSFQHTGVGWVPRPGRGPGCVWNGTMGWVLPEHNSEAGCGNGDGDGYQPEGWWTGRQLVGLLAEQVSH